jgi:hypothetical protein
MTTLNGTRPTKKDLPNSTGKPRCDLFFVCLAGSLVQHINLHHRQAIHIRR